MINGLTNKTALYSVAAILTLWITALIAFVLDAIFFSNVPNSICNNVVVLTGGKNRIDYALRSVGINKPKNMFISGVHEKTTLKAILGNRKTNNKICFILGKSAKNTYENAIEIDDWVKKNKVEKILLITSDYHMRRSICELRHINRALRIIPYASKSEFSYEFLMNCVKEFHKTVYVYAKMMINFWKSPAS
jgi:uncharacterized SAM-binding protein YcdF (DUF218 family)